jgi:hypothetical protein
VETQIPAGVRQNFLANLVAAIAAFLIEAGWYSYFQQAWLAGLGRTREWLQASGLNPALQYGAALAAAFVMATALSWAIQATGLQTVFRGIKVAVLLWIGIVVTSFASEFVFEVRTWTFFGITIGFWLIGMIAMGAIVGAWRKK